MKEEWKDIPGYGGLYQASTQGIIRSLDRYIIRGNYQVFRKGKILKQTRDIKGYLRLSLYKNNKMKTFKVHRAIAITFISNPYNYTQINHINGIKDCNTVLNLEWCSGLENVRHDIKVLEEDPIRNFKLTEIQVREIKCLLRERILTQKQIAKLFNVGTTIISYINTGKVWNHIK